MSRKKNSAKNILFSLLNNIITIGLGILVQAIFVKTLGKDYLGLNGLFGNIITMLSIAELGIGNAITYTLYKPIKNSDQEKIKSLMHFYKKSYQLVGFIVLLIGILIIPFLNTIVDVDTITGNINIYAIYILFLLDAALSYFATYKRCIFNASQKDFILNIVKIFCTIILNVAQILFLLATQNFYLFLLLKIIFRVIENATINIIANKQYPFLKETPKKLDKETEKNIITKIKALFFHKVGSFVVTGTDSIIITKFINLQTVGMYSNYSLIITAVQRISCQALTSITSSVGNLLVTETTKKQFDVFKKIRFLNFYMATIVAIATLIIMEPFITIWIGSEYILDKLTLVILTINLFMMIMRSSYSIFKEAAGIYYEDRFVPLFEALINIISSIILVKIMGLPGVFIGTFISGLTLWCYSYPKYVYKAIFKQKYSSYIKETLGYLLLFTITAAITFFLSEYIKPDNIIIELILKTLVAIVLPIILLICTTFKLDSFKYYKTFLKKLIKKP